MSPVEFKKTTCRCVDFKGQGPPLVRISPPHDMRLDISVTCDMEFS